LPVPARHRSSVAVEMLSSRETVSTDALSGGNNLATALSLNACPYLAISFFRYHPRVSNSIEATTILTQRARFTLLATGLFVSVLVKFDTIMLPFFYFAVHFKTNQWRRTFIESAALLALALSTYFSLGELFPAPLDIEVGFNSTSALSQLQKNAQTLMEMNVQFPPLLVHALPVLLSFFFLKQKDRFVWTAVAFALGMSTIFILFSNYEEVRAHMIVLVLVLPSALLTLKKLLDSN
jgi:hypothetical protein